MQSLSNDNILKIHKEFVLKKICTIIRYLILLLVFLPFLYVLFLLYQDAPKGSILYDIKNIFTAKLFRLLLFWGFISLISIFITSLRETKNKGLYHTVTAWWIPAMFWYVLVTELSTEKLTTLLTFLGSFALFKWFNRYFINSGVYTKLSKRTDDFVDKSRKVWSNLFKSSE